MENSRLLLPPAPTNVTLQQLRILHIVMISKFLKFPNDGIANFQEIWKINPKPN